MPQVPGNIRLAPLPGVRKQAAETPLSTGAGVEQQKARTGEAVAGLGSEIAKAGLVGYQQARRFELEEQERADQLAVLRARNRLSEWENVRLYDPQKGALAQKGEASFGLPETVKAEYDKVASEVGGDLHTDKQRTAYEQVKIETGQRLDLTLRRHVYGEMQRFEGEELQSFLTNSRNSAIANATDPRVVGLELGRAVDAIRQHAPRLGLGPEQVQDQIDKTTTATHVGVIDSLIAQDKAKSAKVYYEEVKDQIAGEARAQVEHKIDVAGTAATGLATSQELWAQFGPKTDTDPINIDAMREAATKRFADDPQTLEATMRFLRERKSDTDAGRKDRIDQKLGKVYLAGSKGALLSDVMKMPEFLDLDAGEQAKAIQYVTSRADQRESRAYTIASRGAAEASRAFTAAQHRRLEEGRQQDAKYYELSNPAVLSQMSTDAIQASRGLIGDENANKLLDRKDKLNSPQALHAATIDDDLFKRIAEDAGLNAYPSQGEAGKDDRATLVRLRDAVETEIAVQQQGRKAALSREEKSKIMESVVDRHVTQDAWFGLSSNEVIGAVVKPDDRATAYVPFAKIPQKNVGEFLNYIRSVSPRTQGQTDIAIAASHKAQIERAYAALVMKLGDAEVTKRLEGR